MSRYYWNKKDTVEESRSVSIAFLGKHGYLCGWRSGAITWTNRWGEQTASIGVTVCTMDGEDRALLDIKVNARLREYPVEAALMPAVRFGQTFTDGKGDTHTLTEEPMELTGAELGGAVILPPEEHPNLFRDVAPASMRISLPADAGLIWPHAMWDPYNLKNDWHETWEKKIVLLLVPVGPDGATLEFAFG